MGSASHHLRLQLSRIVLAVQIHHLKRVHQAAQDAFNNRNWNPLKNLHLYSFQYWHWNTKQYSLSNPQSNPNWNSLKNLHLYSVEYSKWNRFQYPYANFHTNSYWNAYTNPHANSYANSWARRYLPIPLE
jgi:hypothetical protein